MVSVSIYNPLFVFFMFLNVCYEFVKNIVIFILRNQKEDPAGNTAKYSKPDQTLPYAGIGNIFGCAADLTADMSDRSDPGMVLDDVRHLAAVYLGLAACHMFTAENLIGIQLLVGTEGDYAETELTPETGVFFLPFVPGLLYDNVFLLSCDLLGNRHLVMVIFKSILDALHQLLRRIDVDQLAVLYSLIHYTPSVFDANMSAV